MSAEKSKSNPVNTTVSPVYDQLFSSNESSFYFKSLAKVTGFSLSIYDGNGFLVFSTDENPVCASFLKPALRSSIGCPASCEKLIFETLKSNKPSTYKCGAKIINFFVPINYLGEKAVIVGRNGFASHEDYLEFLKIAKNTGTQKIPVKAPEIFIDENQLKNSCQYIHDSTNYILNNLQEKHRSTEKLGRFTSLVDTAILEKLSKNTDFVYRYIIDTIEFILGPTSVAILALDNNSSEFKAVCATGKNKDFLMGLKFNSKNTLMQQVHSEKAPVFTVHPETKKIIASNAIYESELLHLFPILIANNIEGLIAVFERKLPQEDIKIINTLRDYIEVTIENRSLKLTIDNQLEEALTSIYDLSKSIAPVLDWNQLYKTILEKSLELLKAEQGSLMLLNHDTAELRAVAKKSMDSIAKDDMKLRLGEKIAGKVLENGEPLLVEDVENDPRINQRNKSRYKTKSFICLPIKIEDRVSGVLNVSDKISGEAFNEKDLKLIQSFIPNAAIAIERSSLYEKSEKLQQLSLTDPLTGILNRRYLDNRLTEEISRFKRYKHPFSFLMLDIDGFKKYNDTFGHLTGDKVLKNLASTISSSLRNIDIVARFGGDEFVIILPRTLKGDAINIANRLRESVAKSKITSQGKPPQNNLTVSIGLTSFPEDASSTNELLEKADQALFRAKKSGRNKLAHL